MVLSAEPSLEESLGPSDPGVLSAEPSLKESLGSSDPGVLSAEEGEPGYDSSLTFVSDRAAGDNGKQTASDRSVSCSSISEMEKVFIIIIIANSLLS